MKSYNLLKQVSKADTILVEVGSQATKWLLKLDNKDLEMQIMHVTNGQDIETGLVPVWSKEKRGVLRIQEL